MDRIRNRLCWLASAALLVAASLPALAKEPLVPKEHASAFFAALLGEAWEEAPGQFLKGSKAEQSSPDAANQVLVQLRGLRSKLGAPVGYELVKEEPIGTSLVRLVFVLKFEDTPVAWELFYYRPRESWTLLNLNFQAGLRLLRSQ